MWSGHRKPSGAQSIEARIKAAFGGPTGIAGGRASPVRISERVPRVRILLRFSPIRQPAVLFEQKVTKETKAEGRPGPLWNLGVPIGGGSESVGYNLRERVPQIQSARRWGQSWRERVVF
jgi:hypothetical protein